MVFSDLLRPLQNFKPLTPKYFPNQSTIKEIYENPRCGIFRIFFMFLGERQSIAQKGVRAIDARNS